MSTKRVLVGSPVRQKHAVLTQFLQGLDDVDKDGFSVSYYFVDDNIDEKSTEALAAFSKTHDTVIVRGNELTNLDQFSKYAISDVKHIWDASSIRKVAYFKDSIITYALENQFDYLFFIDSDIVLDRRTLQQLASRNVEIVSNVFWTQWQPNWQLEPQCFWMPALARQSRAPFSPPIDPEEARQIQRDFFAKMRIPGLYKVDGLGACTLISHSALEKGVRFQEIPNLSLLGEDRHFCVRAGALGIPLYFDTVYPVYHIYREEYLDRVEDFKRNGFQYDMCQTYHVNPASSEKREAEVVRIAKKAFTYARRKLTAKLHAKLNSPLVYRNKANNTICLHMVVNEDTLCYAADALQSAAELADFCLILDASVSGLSQQLCQACMQEKPFRIIRAESKNTLTDWEMHKRLWDASEEYNPGWIFSLDAEEILQPGAAEAILCLVQNTSIDAYRFQCFFMWNQEEYRADIQNTHLPYLMRYQSRYHYKWDGSSGKFPVECNQLVFANINLKIKNYRMLVKKDHSVPSGENVVLRAYADLSDEL